MNTDKLADAYARLQQGDVTGAQRLCNQILRRESGNARALHLLGISYLSAGNPVQAITILKRGLMYAPADKALTESLGLAHLATQDATEAERIFRQLIDAGPAPGIVHMRLGLALGQLGRASEAEGAFRTALQMSADDPDIYLNLGNLLAGQHRLDEALDVLDTMLARWPQHRDAHYNRGAVLQRLRRFEEAASAYTQALRIDPSYIDSYNNRGIVFESLGKVAEAEASYLEALKHAPDHVSVLNNLGKVLRAQGRIDESARFCQRALALQPDFVDAHLNLASVRAEQGDYAAAATHYREVLRLSPKDADAHLSYGMLCLGMGQFETGWHHYRWRPQRRQVENAGVPLSGSLPADLAGKEILLVGEQGLGDELFFLRYAPWLKQRGARLSGFCDGRIAPLLLRTGLFERMHAHGTVMPESDCRIMIGDLPWVIGNATSDADAWKPRSAPLQLVALAPRIDAMRARLAALGPPPYTGLTWRAGTPPEEQYARVDRALSKNAPIEAFREVLDGVPGTVLALQRRPYDGEIGKVSSALGRDVLDLSAVNDDIEDMLALLSSLGDYIGVSNTNMHLLAGLGGRARVLVPKPPEWRWMTGGSVSPWFPGFSVYRQSADGDWQAAFRALADDLAQDGSVAARPVAL